jgi:hypothetical protein
MHQSIAITTPAPAGTPVVYPWRYPSSFPRNAVEISVLSPVTAIIVMEYITGFWSPGAVTLPVVLKGQSKFHGYVAGVGEQ